MNGVGERRDRLKSKISARELAKDKRRRELLDRQKRDRRNFRDHSRRLADRARGEEDDSNERQSLFGRSNNGGFFGGKPSADMGSEKKAKSKNANKMELSDPEAEAKKREKRERHSRRRREYFAGQLMHPEWMTDIPGDLGPNWYVLPRPEGIRCLVIASRGKTISRKRSGAILHVFSSALPSGNPKQKQVDPCILDCIYHPQNQTYYVLDLMCWSGYSVYDSNTEFRHFWVHSKLSEAPIHRYSPLNKFKFAPIPREPATFEGLKKLYPPVDHGFQMDGLLFVHKQTRYELGLTPLCLLWKDTKTSRYLVDTSDGKSVSQRQNCTLLVQPDLSIVSLEGYVVANLTIKAVEEAKMKIHPKTGSLHKFSISGVSQEFYN
eukprot:1319516-Amorphochlora_amoeboformis.AAC.1